jgi:hypothetical protein
MTFRFGFSVGKRAESLARTLIKVLLRGGRPRRNSHSARGEDITKQEIICLAAARSFAFLRRSPRTARSREKWLKIIKNEFIHLDLEFIISPGKALEMSFVIYERQRRCQESRDETSRKILRQEERRRRKFLCLTSVVIAVAERRTLIFHESV